MILYLVFALAAAIPLVMALPTNGSEDPMMMRRADAQDDCIMPIAFVVRNFRLWGPDEIKDGTELKMDFSYSDNDTGINTDCHVDTNSVSVGPPAPDPRFPCRDPRVQFLWHGSRMTLIEKACPARDQPRPVEAAGEVTLEYNCMATGPDSEYGVGHVCVANDVSGKFVSLQPTPDWARE